MFGSQDNRVIYECVFLIRVSHHICIWVFISETACGCDEVVKSFLCGTGCCQVMMCQINVKWPEPKHVHTTTVHSQCPHTWFYRSEIGHRTRFVVILLTLSSQQT